MAQSRKTRQQKITQTQRKSQQTSHMKKQEVPVSNTGSVQLSKPDQSEIKQTHAYVQQELRRIAWISLLCFALLIVAAFFLADFGWLVQMREWLGLAQAVG